MRKILLLILLLLPIQGYAYDLTLNNVNTQIYFSPNGGCQHAIIKEISNAKRSVYVQAYSYTSIPIAKALLAAHNRGVKVVIIVDKGQQREKYTMATTSQEQGMLVYLDSSHTIAHSKVILIDDETTITGSYNFSKSAEEKNSENIIILKSKEVTAIYNNEFMNHLKHAVIFR